MGMLTGLMHAEDTFQALTCSCGVPSIMPAGELESKNTFTYTQELHNATWREKMFCRKKFLTGNHPVGFR